MTPTTKAGTVRVLTLCSICGVPLTGVGGDPVFEAHAAHAAAARADCLLRDTPEDQERLAAALQGTPVPLMNYRTYAEAADAIRAALRESELP